MEQYGENTGKNEKELRSLKNLEELKGKSYEELIKISNEKSNYFFQRTEGNRVCNDVSYLTDGDIAYADVISTFLMERFLWNAIMICLTI